jgi:hypothetical protein
MQLESMINASASGIAFSKDRSIQSQILLLVGVFGFFDALLESSL